MRFFIYSRKSVYTGKGESVENQIEMCRAYVKQKFSDADDSSFFIYEDEGFSAKNTDRPQFQRMLRDIRIQKPDFILCYRLDRISRNVSDFSNLIEELNNRDISFICIKEEFDTSKPMGKAMMYIASVFAQLERETIAERVRDNMRMLARTGRWLGGTTPAGYTSEKVDEVILDGAVKTAYKLTADPEELATVNLIFNTFLQLHSISGVSNQLKCRNILSRRGKPYSLPGIKSILQNPVYCTADETAWAYFTEQKADVCFGQNDCSAQYGLLTYNKRNYQKKHAPRQPIDQWIIAIGKHRGLITGERWVAVQELLRDNIPTGQKPARHHNSYALLSGRIYCNVCGARMFAKHRTGKHNSSYDYVCQNKLHGGTLICNSQNINGPQADRLVFTYLLQSAKQNQQMVPLLETLKSSLSAKTQQNPLEQLQQQMEKHNTEMDQLVETLAQKELSVALIQRVNSKITRLAQEQQRMEQEYQALKLIAQQTVQNEQITELANSLSDFQTSMLSLSIQEKRALIRQVVQKAVWDGSNLQLFLTENK